MDENTDQTNQQELDAWIKKQLDVAVRKASNQGIVDGLLVEARPAWVAPFQILIGMVRQQGQSAKFDWCISGEVPTDFLSSDVANTPREAAKHFSMKWQLAAARYLQADGQDPVKTNEDPYQENTGEQLIEHAEALYTLIEDDRLWFQANKP